MASLLVGTAAVAGISSASLGIAIAPIAATAGLFGAGGVVTAGGLALGTAAIGGIGLATAGVIGGAQAASAQAKAQAGVSEFNARVARQQAASEEAFASFRQQRQAKEARRRQGRLRAAIGAAGVVPDVGTPLLLQATQAAEDELDNLLIGFQGQIGAARQVSRARLGGVQADIFTQRARNARIAGGIQAGSTLLSGFGGIRRTFA